MSRIRYIRRKALRKPANPTAALKQGTAPFFDFGGEPTFFAGKSAQSELRRQAETPEKEETIQKKETGASTRTAPAEASSQIRSLQGGQPLPPQARQFFEPKFSADFSRVKIHNDGKAHDLAASVEAKAFTYGNHIVFNQGRYDTQSAEGKTLLAHELTHVVQNEDGSQKIQKAEQTPGMSEMPQTDNSAADVKTDLETLLGPLPAKNVYDPARMNELALYLKRIRREYPAQISETQNQLEFYFGAQSPQVWDNSMLPFAGYVGTAVVDGKSLFQSSQKQGLDEAEGKARKVRTAASDVLFFSGHHWGSTEYNYAHYRQTLGEHNPEQLRAAAQSCPGPYGCAGTFVNSPTSSDKTYDIKQEDLSSSRVRLMIITSCNGLNKNGFGFFRSLYPNALILGYASAAPEFQKWTMNGFIEQLPADLTLDNNGLNRVVASWVTYVESIEKKSLGRMLGYALPTEGPRVHYFLNGKWETRIHEPKK